MQTMDSRDHRARLALAMMQFPTTENALDSMLLNRIGQLWFRYREGASHAQEFRDLLIAKNAGHYVELLTHDEVRDFRRRNRMTVPMPNDEVTDFMQYVESSLRRTGLGSVLRTLNVAVETRRDRYRHVHIVFVDKSPRS